MRHDPRKGSRFRPQSKLARRRRAQRELGRMLMMEQLEGRESPGSFLARYRFLIPAGSFRMSLAGAMDAELRIKSFLG